LQKLMWNSC